MESLWINASNGAQDPQPTGRDGPGRSAPGCLTGETTADVVVIGAGITGTATALRLAEAGLKVVVLEARSAGEGNTGRSTGNLYATTSTGLATLGRKWRDNQATLAVSARAAAIEWIDSTASRLGIDCGLVRVPLHQCVLNAGSPAHEQLRSEHEAAIRLGLEAEWGDEVPGWPLSPAAVHTLPGQAHFNPFRFVDGLVEALQQRGGVVYEHSRVVDIDASEGLVTTAEGSVRAGHIVLATHTPAGFNVLQAEMEVYREYGVAAPLEGDGPADASVWVMDGKHSVRTHEQDGTRYIVIVGEKHKTGEGDEHADYFGRLRDFGRQNFPVGEFTHAWSAQQYTSADGLPYIGRSAHDNVLIATGMGADGLVWGTVAAAVIERLVRGDDDDELSELLSPRRFTPVKSAKSFAAENATVAGHMVGDRVDALRSDEDLADVPLGGGRVLRLDGETCAVHRTLEGRYIALSPVCPHMGCHVKWNQSEQSWDCPCHGSRFDTEGRVLEGPALTSLESRNLDR